MDIRSITSGAGQGLPVAEKSTARAASPAGAVASAAAPAAKTEVDKVQKAPTTEQVKQAVESINKSMQAMSQNLEFAIDPDSHRTIVKVIDHETKEVLRQIPNEEVLEIAKAIDKMQGLLIRQKA